MTDDIESGGLVDGSTHADRSATDHDAAGAVRTAVDRPVDDGALVLDLRPALARGSLGHRPGPPGPLGARRPEPAVDRVHRFRGGPRTAVSDEPPPASAGRAATGTGRWGPALHPTDDPQLVRCALEAGQRDRARRIVATTEHRARTRPGDPVVLAAHAHAAGLIDGDVDELLRAASLLDVRRWPFAHASALEDAGRLVHDRERAAAVLETAMRTYDRIGAVRDAARVRSRLRDLGVHRRREVRPASGTGWASLTPSELEVVRLVCRGATNRQAAKELYLSPHTVSSHLRHAFTKLDISSRVELTRIALAHGEAELSPSAP